MKKSIGREKSACYTARARKEQTIQKKLEKEYLIKETILKDKLEDSELYFDFADVMLIVIGKDQQVIKINKKASKVLGYPVKQIIGKNYFDNFIPKRFRDEMKAFFNDIVSGKRVLRKYFENPVITKRGERLIAWHNTVLKDKNGNIVGTLSSGEDITEKREKEEHGLKAERRFRTLFENAPAGYIACDTRCVINDVNQTFLNITGYGRDEIIGKHLWKLIHPSDRENFESMLVNLKNSENIGISKFRIRNRDGIIVDVYCTAKFSGQQDQMLQILVHDITHRRIREVFQQAHLEVISLLNVTNNVSTLVSKVSGILKRKLDFEKVFVMLKDNNSEHKKKDNIEVFVSDYLRGKRPSRVQFTKSGSFVSETKKNGKEIFFSCVPLNISDKLAGALVCVDKRKAIFSQVMIDFLETIAGAVSIGLQRCETFEILKKTNENYNAFINATDDMTFIKDSKFRYIQLNMRYARFFKKPVSEIIGKTDFDLMDYSAAKRCRETDIQAIKENKLVVNEEVVGERIYETKKFPVKLGTDEIGIGAFIRDITETRQARERIENLLWMYSMLCQINQTMTRAKDRQQVFKSVCNIATSTGRFTMAWIGIADYKKQTVIPVAVSKVKAGYLENIHISLNPGKAEGKGPTARAIRTGRCCVCNDILNDSRMKPWKMNAEKYGFCSSAAIPIRVGGSILGALNLYSDRLFFFGKEIKKLLINVAADIGYCLEMLIVEQKRALAEQQLRKNEAHMRVLYDRSPFPLAEIDCSALKKVVSSLYSKYPDDFESHLKNVKSGGTYRNLLIILHTNEQMYALFETRDHEKIVDGLLKTILIPSVIIDLLKGKTQIQFESAIQTSAGTEKNILATISPVVDLGMKWAHIILSIADITDRIKMEKIIKANLERFNGFFNSSSAGMALLDLYGRPVMLNSSICDFLGYSMQELMQMKLMDVVHPEEKKVVENTYRKLAEGTINSYESERRYIRKDGSVVWGRVSANRVFDSVSNTHLVAAVLKDITEIVSHVHRIERIQRILRTLAFINHSIVRISDERQLLMDVCRIIRDDALFEISLFVLKSDSKFQIITCSDKHNDFASELQKIIIDKDKNTPEIQTIIEEKPVIINDIISSYYSDDWKHLNSSYNFHSTICLPVFVEKNQIGSLNIYSKEKNRFNDKEETNILHAIGDNIGYGITMIRLRQEEKQSAEKLEQSFIRLQNTIEGISSAIAKMVETRDPYTAGHQIRVAQLSMAIAREMGLPDDVVQGLRFASILHDIGKANIPVEILVKPTKLTDDEFSIIKLHSLIGYEILSQIPFPWPVPQIVRQHHERLNGSGYPDGLKEKDILLEAKIIAVADVVEAMAYDRPYRPALGIDNALKEIRDKSDILFDRNVVDICIKLFKEKGFSFD